MTYHWLISTFDKCFVISGIYTTGHSSAKPTRCNECLCCHFYSWISPDACRGGEIRTHDLTVLHPVQISVGEPGFEPGTSRSQTVRANQLRHSPKFYGARTERSTNELLPADKIIVFIISKVATLFNTNEVWFF